tara:strand:- start:20 stop:253 length:234 start_codon:yes stop_codon:yes gene_type:complete
VGGTVTCLQGQIQALIHRQCQPPTIGQGKAGNIWTGELGRQSRVQMKVQCQFVLAPPFHPVFQAETAALELPIPSVQ